jgi:tetratricopeptide (TPR) repeat protein
LAKSYQAIGEVYWRLRDVAGARDYYGKSLELREKLFAANPNSFRLKLELAGAWGSLGEILLRSGDPQAAEPHCKRSLEYCQELMRDDAKNVDYQRDLSGAYYRMGKLAARLQDRPAAEGYYRECLKIREEMAAADPKNDRKQMKLIVPLARCGEHRRAAEVAERLRAGKAADTELLFEVACGYALCSEAAPDDPELRRRYAERAVGALEEADAKGYKDVASIETDPDLDPIRELPGYKALLEKIRGQRSAVRDQKSEVRSQ